MNLRLLFLGPRDGCGCSMAAAFARRRAAPGTVVACAVAEPPGTTDPLMAEVMAEVGLPGLQATGATLDEVLKEDLDLIVVVSPGAAAPLFLLPGEPTVVRWNLPDPARFSLAADRRREEFRALRDRIRQQVAELFERGYLDAIRGLRASHQLLLDSVSDGILVHDLQRRIVQFNRAAVTITGYQQQDVIGRECTEVFGCGFCGGKCTMEGVVAGEPGFDERRERLHLTSTEGDARTLDARVRPLRDADGRWVGLVLLFHDVTREFALARRVGEIESFAGIVGRDAAMLEVYDLIRDVADSSVPILIRGESGTGKELVAAAIHHEGVRSGKAFVAVNCGALPEGLLESELFGHVRGAFTGAIRDKKGRFEIADGGTIFLDEIGDISAAMQVRLLRVLQEGVIQRVGSETGVKVDVRVISATHRDLQQEIAAGRFREDLFYRLNVVPIWIPPLRERLADIPLLVEHLLGRYVREMGRDTRVRVTAEVMDVLLAYEWPGNVRELQNWLQYALVKCRGEEIRLEHLPPARLSTRRPAPPQAAAGLGGRTPLSVPRVREALARCRGNRRQAARELGVARATLYRFLAAHPEEAADPTGTSGDRDTVTRGAAEAHPQP